MFYQVLDVNLPVLTPAAVDVGRPGALTTLLVARQTVTLLRQRHVERLEVTGRVDHRTVGDAFSLEGSVPLADSAPGAVRIAFLTLSVATTTAF